MIVVRRVEMERSERLKINYGEKIVRTWRRFRYDKEGINDSQKVTKETSGILKVITSVFINRHFLSCILQMPTFHALLCSAHCTWIKILKWGFWLGIYVDISTCFSAVEAQNKNKFQWGLEEELRAPFWFESALTSLSVSQVGLSRGQLDSLRGENWDKYYRPFSFSEFYCYSLRKIR